MGSLYKVEALSRQRPACYALKLMKRQRTFEEETDKMRYITAELFVLRRLTQIRSLTKYHFVELVGSFTGEEYIGALLQPVGEWNLEDYLKTFPAPTTTLATFSLASNTLLSFFGCLASAIAALHKIKIRHRGVKPQNILVHGASI